jgi:magnesium transporter
MAVLSTRSDTRHGGGAHKETARDHMLADTFNFNVDDTVDQVRTALLEARIQSPELLLVRDRQGCLAGAVPLTHLFSLASELRMADAMDPSFPRVGADTDQETAASLALHHAVDALPVVDDAGHPVGVLPTQALLQVLRREHVEDLHRLAGIDREVAQARHAIEDPPLRRARHRLPWLFVGLGGSALSTLAMASFESTMRGQIAVAFFVPAIIYLADAIGTQSEAIAVRGLSLTRAGIAHLLIGELRTGMVIGLALAGVALPLVWLALGDLRLAVAVSTAIFFAGSVACMSGFALPWLLAQMSVDPAYGSGPLATILQDILSLLVYMAVVHLLLVPG